MAKKRVGLMGGTFDPIHYGHLVTAESARTKFGLDQVIFIPCGDPPHKDKGKVSPAAQRLMMVTLATITNSYFHVSDVEIRREGYSYTYDTVEYFHKHYRGSCELFFITGADAIRSIYSWKNMELLLERCFFIAATRPGFNLEEWERQEQLPLNLWQRIHFMAIPALAISSTDIRSRVGKGEAIKYLLPREVEAYIGKQGLYKAVNNE
ncbi:MAG: nicotinate-nucleotide adenylyltransferase [Clostridiales bacterium]|jgi:nicotinate-nucleotide adenylyltransferase|nr:nicotinate-nucleotide adenylyltransferase [Clostridiales bacterium]